MWPLQILFPPPATSWCLQDTANVQRGTPGKGLSELDWSTYSLNHSSRPPHACGDRYGSLAPELGGAGRGRSM